MRSTVVTFSTQFRVPVHVPSATLPGGSFRAAAKQADEPTSTDLPTDISEKYMYHVRRTLNQII